MILMKYLGLKYDFESSLSVTHNAAVRSCVILKTEEPLHSTCTTSHMINTITTRMQMAATRSTDVADENSDSDVDLTNKRVDLLGPAKLRISLGSIVEVLAAC